MHLPFPVLTAQDAAAMIKHGQTVGFSAFTPAGSAKAIPRAIAERAKTEHAAGRSYQIRVLTGASTGESLDGALASANAISFRAPWQNDKTLRALINSRQVPYLDMHGAMHVRLRNRAHPHPRDTGSDHRRYSFLPAASPFASAGDLKQPGDRPPPGNHLHQHRTRRHARDPMELGTLSSQTGETKMRQATAMLTETIREKHTALFRSMYLQERLAWSVRMSLAKFPQAHNS